ncbi:MAG: glycosyltransferase family 2 protein [Phycisphaerales bacterium]
MHIALAILLWACVAVSATTAICWLITAFHILRTMVCIPSLRDGLTGTGATSTGLPPTPGTPEPAVCVVIPAHNEERVIAMNLGAMLEQDYGRLSVVYALDRCTDRTEAIIREGSGSDPRISVLRITECPEPWVGKVHALHTAVSTAEAARSADLLLFLDADTIPAPNCITAAVSLMRQRGDDLLSVLSTLTSERWFELIAQPVAGFELLRQYPLYRANDRVHPRPFANGQFILVKRVVYEALGGHRAVMTEVLEDVWLARTFSRAGHRCGFYFSGDLLRCRMYEEWDRFRRGWLRIYGECASRKPDRLRRSAWVVVLFMCVLPLASLGTAVMGAGLWVAAPESGRDVAVGAALLAGSSGLIAWLGAMSLVYRLGRTPVWASPASVVGGWLVAGLLREAARNYERNRPVVWGGKEYHRDQR